MEKKANFVFNQMSPYNGTPYAKCMVESIRRYMPESTIIQLSDRYAAPVRNVDQVVKNGFDYDRNTYPQIWFHLLCSLFDAAKVKENGIVCCDADVLFGGDVTGLLNDDYDIAICKRPANGGDETSDQYRILHPYNSGFMIIKNPYILWYCRNLVESNLFNRKAWDLGQHVLGLVINSGEFNVKLLDGDIYNRCPKSSDDWDISTRVWHFKGGRKNWMTEWQTDRTK